MECIDFVHHEDSTDLQPFYENLLHNTVMKKTTIALSLSTLMTLSPFASALELVVVNNYDLADSSSLWKDTKTDQVPSALLSSENVSSPSMSYSALFPKTFMQESLFAVCYQDCDNKDGFRLDNGEIRERDLKKWDTVEQANVYFWLSSYFNFLESKLNYRPNKFLKVITNRELRDETAGKKMKNNAFFNPGDISLSFLPASKNLMFKLMGGKINRSGFDPSVIVHEASHYLFHHLLPNTVNDEIGGLNEGFADYMANIFLNNSKVGLVMLHGKVLRDSAVEVDSSGRFKTYAPKMEVHDLGERISLALWKTRDLSTNKNEFDRLVIDAIIGMRNNPYSSVHDFKQKMIERIPSIVENRNLTAVKTIWETIFSGTANRLSNKNFFNSTDKARNIIGFKERQEMSHELAQEYGVSAVQESNYVVLHQENISENQKASFVGSKINNEMKRFWIIHDTSRSNILGIYDESENLITDTKTLETVKKLADNVSNLESTTKDFTEKVKAFAELSKGKGEFSLVYKVRGINTTEYNAEFNENTLAGQKIEIKIKRKAIVGRLLGLPEITGITLYTAPISLGALPEINGQRVIGYKLALKTGTAMEVILNNIAL